MINILRLYTYHYKCSRSYMKFLKFEYVLALCFSHTSSYKLSSEVVTEYNLTTYDVYLLALRLAGFKSTA